jgi:hypothetical protein
MSFLIFTQAIVVVVVVAFHDSMHGGLVEVVTVYSVEKLAGRKMW